MHVRQFLVLPRLPERIKPLQELAHNLWYSWNWEIVELFIRLDSEMWERVSQNPVSMLAQLPQETLEQAAADDGFVVSLNRIYEKYKAYMERSKWFGSLYDKVDPKKPLAYFSLEYGLDTGLPVYSGGLGVLSGDTVKTSSDLGIPMVAVGLLYRYGYFRQFLSEDGWQQERYEENDWYHMPVSLVKDEHDTPLRITVTLDHAPVHCQIWRVNVGQTPLYLLDTNIPENAIKSREITSVLYGGDKDMRVRQEIILGIGGVRALHALGYDPPVYHLNEGHSWFLMLERIRFLMKYRGLSFMEAWQFIWSTTVFTTHTPVPAGNERFDPVLLERYLSDHVAELGISWNDFVSMGRIFPEDDAETFCMTVAALRSAAFANGVSRLHGRVTREMWHNIWPNLPVHEVPIGSVTNGVHSFSWLSHDMRDLYEAYLGAKFLERPEDFDVYDKIKKIPDSELWRVHNRRRERLIFFARKRLKQQLQRRGASRLEINRAEQILDPSVLTIGFARRFSTYKRGHLMFSDTERLEALVNHSERPVQILISGKAHPLDTPGKEIIKSIVAQVGEDRFRDRIVFLEDYDINIARYLVQGVDVWLNNPRRPEEASGTSGMKAALNGAVNVSILDGWWDEGYSEQTGFKIGNGEEYENVDIQDRIEAEKLYYALEREVVPLFYDIDELGLPSKWIERMKGSIMMAGKQFSTFRMMMDYARSYYIPAYESALKMSADDFARTRQAADWLERVHGAWDKIVIRDVDVPDPGSTLYVGEKLPVTIDIFLGQLSPEEVRVEIIAGQLSSHERIHDYKPVPAELDGSDVPGEKGVYRFKGMVRCDISGRFGIKARVLPHSDLMPHTLKPKLISWW